MRGKSAGRALRRRGSHTSRFLGWRPPQWRQLRGAEGQKTLSLAPSLCGKGAWQGRVPGGLRSHGNWKRFAEAGGQAGSIWVPVIRSDKNRCPRGSAERLFFPLRHRKGRSFAPNVVLGSRPPFCRKTWCKSHKENKPHLSRDIRSKSKGPYRAHVTLGPTGATKMKNRCRSRHWPKRGSRAGHQA